VILPRIHAITDGRVLAMPDLRACVEDLARHGSALALHVRDRQASARDLSARALEVSGWLAGSGVALIVNARPDVARATSGAGVQLGASDLTTADARTVFPTGWIGRSTHSLRDVAIASDDGADFVLLGPVFETASHPGSTPLGLTPLPRTRIPVIAIGGITLERVPTVRAAGYYGVAAIRAIWDAPAPGDAVAAMLVAESEARTHGAG
jgi:thiamine-phosphate diphosphorylase